MTTMTNRDVCKAVAAEMGGYNGNTDIESAGEELALDLSETRKMRIKLPDGREFPTHDGITALSWPIESHFTLQDERDGYVRCKAVLSEYSDEQLEKARFENLKASFDRIFGHNARKLLNLIENEISKRLDEMPKPERTRQ